MQQQRNYWKCLKIIENAIPSIIEGILPLPREFFLYRNLLTCVNSVVSHVLYSKQYFNIQYTVYSIFMVPWQFQGGMMGGWQEKNGSADRNGEFLESNAW